MESALRSLTTKTPSSFPHPPLAHQVPLLPLPPAHQVPLLPLPPAQAPAPQHAFRPAPRAKKQPRCLHAAPNTKMALPITVAAVPAHRRVDEVEWTETDSLYSVSPPPSCVPMPTSSLLATAAAAKKAPTTTACAVDAVTGAVDVGATDELRRLLRL